MTQTVKLHRGIGSLRHISDHLLNECYGEQYAAGSTYMSFIAANTETRKADAEKTFETLKTDMGLSVEDDNKLHDAVWQLVNACELAAFEKGARYGARMLHELLELD